MEVRILKKLGALKGEQEEVRAVGTESHKTAWTMVARITQPVNINLRY